MARLQIFDKFGELLESHELSEPLISWIENNVPSYRPMICPPYSATKNGNFWPHECHSEPLSDGDLIELVIEPKDPATLTAIYVALFVVSVAYSYYVYSNLPDGYESSTESGNSIYNANARGNRPEPSGVIRAVSGKVDIYPDLICPVHRKFIDHEEFLYLMLSVGEGYFFLRNQNIFIAETPIINYLGDITAHIFEPGDDVSLSDAHENWFESEEIAALELTTASGSPPGNWTVDASGDEFTSYLDGVAEEFPFAVGEKFEILTGSNIGVYVVDSISGADNEIATVISQNVDFLASVEAVQRRNQLNRFSAQTRSNYNRAPGASNRNLYVTEDEPSTTLATVTAEAITWRGIGGGVNWEGPFEIIPRNETCRYIEIDVNFPGGLVELNNDGDPINKTLELAIEYRAVGSDEWLVMPGTSFTDNTYDERGYTLLLDCGANIRPELRFRRVTRESDSVSVSEDVYILRVKSLLTSPTYYPDITTIGLAIRGTNALAGSAENKINIRDAYRKLPTLAEIEDAANGTPYDLTSAATLQTGSQWEINSLTFINSSSFSGDYAGVLSAIDLDSTGTYFLICIGANLISYQLTTPFDLKSAVFIGALATKNTIGSVTGARWGDSGTKVYLLKSSTEIIYQYDMSTAYNLSTAVDSTYLIGVGAVTNSPQSFSIEGGAKLYIANADGNIYQYTLSTPWRISTATYDAVSYDVSAQLGADNVSGVRVSNGLTRLYVLSDDSTVYSYTLGTSGNISTSTYDSESSVVSVTDPNYGDLWVGEEYLFASETDFSSVRSFSLLSVTDSRATRSIARFVANSVYDVIGSDAATLIDWEAFDDLDDLLDPREDFLDAEFKDDTTLWEALKIMLAPGYSEPVLKEGRLLPVRSSGTYDISHIYMPNFMLDEGLVREDSHYDGQEPDGVDVEYLDETTGEMEIVECRLPGDAGLRPKRIQSVGIINEEKAWRYGMRERRRLRYKPAQYSFKTEMDALNSNYGDVIVVASEIFSSQTGAVKSQSGPLITLDFEPVFGSGTHYAAFKKPDGRYSGLYEVEATASPDVIELVSPVSFDFDPVLDSSSDEDGENTLISFGAAEEWGDLAIVRNIQKSGEFEVEVVAEEFLTEIYADDDNSPS